MDLAARVRHEGLSAVLACEVPYVEMLSDVIVEEFPVDKRGGAVLDAAFEPMKDRKSPNDQKIISPTHFFSFM